MKTPRTEKRANEIINDLERMKLDDWHEAYAEMGKHARKLEIEIEMLRHREETCETMDRAENFALFRAVQEIGRVVGLTDENSPREIVERVKLMSENGRTES